MSRKPTTRRTMIRDRNIDSNRSIPSSCFPRLISVSVTDRAFRDSQRVATISAPAMTNSGVWERTSPPREDSGRIGPRRPPGERGGPWVAHRRFSVKAGG